MLQWDDPLDTIAVHAWNGTWGVRAVGLQGNYLFACRVLDSPAHISAVPPEPHCRTLQPQVAFSPVLLPRLPAADTLLHSTNSLGLRTGLPLRYNLCLMCRSLPSTDQYFSHSTLTETAAVDKTLLHSSIGHFTAYWMSNTAKRQSQLHAKFGEAHLGELFLQLGSACLQPIPLRADDADHCALATRLIRQSQAATALCSFLTCSIRDPIHIAI